MLLVMLHKKSLWCDEGDVHAGREKAWLAPVFGKPRVVGCKLQAAGQWCRLRVSDAWPPPRCFRIADHCDRHRCPRRPHMLDLLRP